MKVKRLGIMLVLLVVVGCSSVSKEKIDVCAAICAPNGGLNKIQAGIVVHDCYCNNGVSITMYMNVIKDNKPKD